MISPSLITANALIPALQCCSPTSGICNCVSSLNADYTTRPDSYNCVKKMSTYALKYGPAYASEIYHYLAQSNIIPRIDPYQCLNICSLGCGFSPDYFAIKQYLQDQNIGIGINYVGLDISQSWQQLRPITNECNYIQHDLSQPLPQLQGIDIIVVGKVYSTLHRNNINAASSFINNLNILIANNPGAVLIFVDINHWRFGRDIFHNSMRNILTNFAQYYFDEPGCYSEANWIPIQPAGLVFATPPGLIIPSNTQTGKSVIFEYMK